MLKIEKNGDITVKAPLKMPDNQVQEFIKKKAKWIIEKRAEVLSRVAPPQKFAAGDKFFFLGVQYDLEIIDSPNYAIKFENGKFYLAGDVLGHASQYFELWYRRQARPIFAKRLEYFSKTYNLPYNGFKISGAESRWGSCSSKKRINLSWKLVLAPLEVVDYVIVHELCHTREMNHGKKFWALVESIQPDYKSHLHWLKENGARLEV